MIFTFNMPNIKKNTYEQHDNELGSFYKSTVNSLILENNILKNNLSVDICIVGGGFTGISSAINLSKKGFSVAVFEAREIGWGASGRNGGQLGIGMRKEQKFLEKKLGMNHAKELWKIGIEAVDEVKSYIKDYNIDCSIKQGVLSAGCFPSDEIFFLKEIDHMQKYYNFDNIQFLDKKNIKEEINTNLYYSGVINQRSFHLNPLKLLYGLTQEAKKIGVHIFENTPINKIEETKEGVKLVSKNMSIYGNYIVLGCNGYLDNLIGNHRNKFMPINNYIIATEPLGEIKAKEIIKNNYAVCDTRFIIDYYRFSEDWRLIFGGGETFSVQFLNNPENIVKKRMYKVFPQLKEYKIEFVWGGTLAISVNRLPIFGTLFNGKLIYAHGYSGHGLALSILAGKLITEKILGYKDRFNFFEKIKHLSIFGGDFLRRPIYASAISYYKFRDLFI